MGEPGAWGEVTAGLRVSRPVLVARLLELDAAGALTTAHVRAGAQVGGVSVRTVWRWLEAARTEGRAEPRPRARLELSDQAWEVLARAGGNVAVLHRHHPSWDGRRARRAGSLAARAAAAPPTPGGERVRRRHVGPEAGLALLDGELLEAIGTPRREAVAARGHQGGRVQG
ncbi:hypothetical protein ACWY4P_00830 [Streptomyces sp. LZ34]